MASALNELLKSQIANVQETGLNTSKITMSNHLIVALGIP